jgi:hypothetical protein
MKFEELEGGSKEEPWESPFHHEYDPFDGWNSNIHGGSVEVGEGVERDGHGLDEGEAWVKW